MPIDRIRKNRSVRESELFEFIQNAVDNEEQEWQEVFVYLLDNAELYGDRITALINKNFGDNWFTMNWTKS